jgi:C4-dicarboxylate-binding protein DctP
MIIFGEETMKKRSILYISILIVAFFGQTAQAEKVLRLTLQLPATHHLGVNVQSFADEVNKNTNGEVKVEIYT